MTIQFDHIWVTGELDKVIMKRLYIQKYGIQKVLHKNKIALINIIAYISILFRYIITCLMLKSMTNLKCSFIGKGGLNKQC